MGVFLQRLILILAIKMGQGNAVWNLNGEVEILRNCGKIFLNHLRTGQADLVRSKQRPEPLVDFHAAVMPGIFFQEINIVFIGIYQSAPGRVFPTASANVQLCHDLT